MKSGIYIIICKANGDRYVGSSKNMNNRKRDHWTNLRNGSHHNTHLQNVWNKYGENSFSFGVLEEVETHLLLEREQYYIDTLKPELNKSLRAESGFLGLRHKEETKEKLRDIQAKRMKSPELIERLRKAAKEQNARQPNAMKGRILTDDQKQHLRDAAIKQFSSKEKREKHSETMRKWMTDEMRDRIRKKQTGKKATIETKNKMSEMHSKIWRGYSEDERLRRVEAVAKRTVESRAKYYKGFVSPDGVVFENIYNLSSFCREHNLQLTSMWQVDKGIRRQHKGWKKL